MQNPLLLHHEKMGAVLQGNKIPLRYTTLEEEYWTVRKKVGIADLSHLGRLSVTGKDRLAFLNGLLTNNLTKLKENGGMHSALLNPKARVLADLYLYNQADAILVDTGEMEGAEVKKILDQFIITEDVAIKDVDGIILLLTIQGPMAAQVVEEVLRTKVSDLGPLDSKSIGPSLIVARDRTGQGGYDLFLPFEEAEAVWQSFLLKGRELGLEPVGLGAMEVLRLEKGLPKYGVDVNENTIVLEAGYADAISFDKGCYVGQEVVARATHIGHVNKKLVQLQLDASESVTNAVITSGGKEVGTITSNAFSPGLGKVVGLGYVPRDSASPGTGLTVEAEGKSFPAKVTKIV